MPAARERRVIAEAIDDLLANLFVFSLEPAGFYHDHFPIDDVRAHCTCVRTTGG
jgi:hypothetical protein